MTPPPTVKNIGFVIEDNTISPKEENKKKIHRTHKRTKIQNIKNEIPILKGDRRRKLQNLFKKLNSSTIEKIAIAKLHLNKAINVKSQNKKKSKPKFSIMINNNKSEITKRHKTHDRSRIIQNIEKFKSLDVNNKEKNKLIQNKKSISIRKSQLTSPRMKSRLFSPKMKNRLFSPKIKNRLFSPKMKRLVENLKQIQGLTAYFNGCLPQIMSTQKKNYSRKI